MSLKIALIGAGAMGGAIGTRLLETGQAVTVFDLDADRVSALVARGARAAPSAAAAAAEADHVITSLNSPSIVEAAVFGCPATPLVKARDIAGGDFGGSGSRA